MEAKERRFTLRNLEETQSENSRLIKGYSAVFNTFYRMWDGYSETIKPGAFDGCDMSDVVALFNHEDENLLARSTDGEGTLKLGVDDKGLYFEFEAPNTTIGNDVLENVRLKNIQGCSFAFTVKEQLIREDVPQSDGTYSTIREITKIGKLYDVGPVVNPAYKDTEIDAAKRSVSEEIEKMKPKICDIYYTHLNFKIK